MVMVLMPYYLFKDIISQTLHNISIYLLKLKAYTIILTANHPSVHQMDNKWNASLICHLSITFCNWKNTIEYYDKVPLYLCEIYWIKMICGHLIIYQKIQSF